MSRIHCIGTITNDCDMPLKYGYIVIERTDEDYVSKNGRTAYKLNNVGNYDFFLKEGYYNLYSLENKDATSVLLGKAHVKPEDTYVTCTVEELIARCELV